jgi:hypothetical protein
MEIENPILTFPLPHLSLLTFLKSERTGAYLSLTTPLPSGSSLDWKRP